METQPGSETPSEKRRLDRATALAAALVAAFCYGASLPQRITFGGDCGELASAAWCLGVPHPTGYPLWILLAKACSGLLPCGTVAWRMAALSAACGALAVGLVCWIVVRATDDRPAGLVAASTLLCCGTFGAQATIVEVYALQIALLAALLFGHHEWVKTKDQRWLALIGLGYGFAFGCHVAVVLFWPGTLWLLWRADERRATGQPRWWQGALRIVVWAVPPLALYALLPLRASLNPPLAWGSTNTLDGFIAHLTGRIYKSNLGVDGAELLRYVGNHLYYLAADLRWSAVLAVLGVWAVWTAHRPMAVMLLSGAAGALLFAAFYRVGDRANYVLPAYLVASILAGYGTHWLRGRTIDRRPDIGLSGQLYFSLLVLALPLVPSWPGWIAAANAAAAHTSMRRDDRAAQLIDAVLDDTPDNAALLVLSDELAFGLWYEQLVEGRRRDVLVAALGTVSDDASWARCKRAVVEQSKTRPVAAAFWDPRLAQFGRWTFGGPVAELAAPGGVPEVRLGGLGPVADDDQATDSPAAPGWRLLSAELDVAVHEDSEHGVRLRLKPRTLAAVAARWEAGRAADYDAVTACFHRSEAAKLDPTWRDRGGRVINDSSGQPVTWCVLREPYGPAADAYRLAVGQVLDEVYPLALPERSVSGTWVVRVGLVPHATPLDTVAKAWAATVPAGVVESFER